MTTFWTRPGSTGPGSTTLDGYMARPFVDTERGVWLEGLDRAVAEEVEALCRVIAGCVTDASIMLTLFDRDRRLEVGRPIDEERSRLESERRRDLEQDGWAPDPNKSLGDQMVNRMDTLSRQAMRDVTRAKWEAGELPYFCAVRLPFLHARNFTISLAQLKRALAALAKIDTGPARKAIVEALDGLDRAIPALKEVRDSVEHVEDRRRGLGRDKKKLPAVPFDGTFIVGGANLQIGEALRGDRFGTTASDGSFVEVEVSDATLEAARAAAQAVFDALPWQKGARLCDPPF